MSSTPIDPRCSAYVFPPNRVVSSSINAIAKSQTFLQALSDTMHNSKQDSGACVSTYVHPLVKKLSAKLSEKSLEMCTERLGSETGSDITNDPMINSLTMIHRKKEIKIVAKTKREYNFPPPLTSIDDSISIESHRQNGRLVMHAVVFTETSDSLFHAERINGRLTLRLKKGGLEKGDKNKGEFGTKAEDDETGEGQEAEDEDLNGNMKIIEGSIGIDENMSRIGRCNEAGGERRGEGHLWNLETCWVTT